MKWCVKRSRSTRCHLEVDLGPRLPGDLVLDPTLANATRVEVLSALVPVLPPLEAVPPPPTVVPPVPVPRPPVTVPDPVLLLPTVVLPPVPRLPVVAAVALATGQIVTDLTARIQTLQSVWEYSG